MSNPENLPETPCHRRREHPAHEVFPPGMSLATGWCAGVGATLPPEQLRQIDDPFEGIPEDEDWGF
jgi:hypothetical protein